MDRVTGLAVTAVRELLSEGGGEPESGEGVGLVLGTTTGSAQSMMDITRDTLVHEKRSTSTPPTSRTHHELPGGAVRHLVR